MKLFFVLFLCCYLAYIWSLYGFCEKYLKDLKMNKKIFAGILFLGGMSVNLLLGWANIPHIFKMSVSHVLFTGLLIMAFRDDMAKKILATAILIVAKTLVCNFGCSFFSCLILVGMNIATGGRAVTFPPELENLITGLAYLMAALAITILRKRLDTVFENRINSWYFMLAVPLFFLVLLTDVVNWGASNGIVVVSHASRAGALEIFYDQIFSHTAICLLTVLAMCIAYGLVFGMDKIFIEQRRAERYNSQIAYYKMLHEQYFQMERLRHDIKNHVLSLYGLWKGSEWDKMGNYLKRMSESGSIGTDDEVTGSKAMDALLYDKRKRAVQSGILWKCDVQIPANHKFDEFDLCVLFGNVLDNALNACEQEQEEAYRFVEIMSRRVKNCFLLIVKNGTDKQDIREIKRGIGLLNIHETVKKYDGSIDTRIENHVFEISILLPIE